MTCVCAWCAQPMEARSNRRWCSTQCHTAGSHHIARGRPGWGPGVSLLLRRSMRVCDWCGGSFRAAGDHRNPDGVQRYCSNECRYGSGHGKWASRQQRDEAMRAGALERLVRALDRRLARLSAPPFRMTGPWWGPCVACLTPIVHRHGKHRMCESCAREGERQARRAVKRRRRLRVKEARAPYRDVDIFQRDGYRCHFRDTDQCVMPRARCKPDADRMLDDWAPTIDHLVPIAAGGSDTPTNVACAHRRCNWYWREFGTSQLRWAAA